MIGFQLAAADDADELMRLERRATRAGLVHIFGTDRPYPSDDVRARWALVLDEPDVTTLIASDDGEGVGYAAYDEVELRHFGVVPERFGIGLADALHTHVLHRAGHGLRLWVLEDNHRARRFYERHGWRADGRSEPDEFPPHPTRVGYELRAC